LFSLRAENKSGSGCDLTNIQNFYFCEIENNRSLKGFKCPICEKGKCKWYLEQSAEMKKTDPKQPERVEYTQKLEIHVKSDCYYEINRFMSEGCVCSCCGAPLKDMVEVDFIKKDKCIFCKRDKIMAKEFCVKWVYGCPDGHKEILNPAKFKGVCPVLIKDAKGKLKPCDKHLDKVELSLSEISYNYTCPGCKQAYDNPGKCQACKKELAKIRICPKSGQFPHVNEKGWTKIQKDKWDEMKKSE
jgi:hypothetical protein